VSPHNDPLIKDLYEKLPHMTNAQAAEIGLALQRVVRGENLDDIDPDKASAYREYMHQLDVHSNAYEKDKARFITESHNEANRPSERTAAKLRVEGQQRYSQIKAERAMNAAEKKQIMRDHIKNGPFEEVYVDPKVVLGRIGEGQTTTLEGQIVGLNGVQLYLEPGVNKRVPKLYAERYRQIKHGQNETRARKEILSGKGIDPTGGPRVRDGWEQLADRMHEINKEYGSTAGSGESGDNWLTPDLHQKF